MDSILQSQTLLIYRITLSAREAAWLSSRDVVFVGAFSWAKGPIVAKTTLPGTTTSCILEWLMSV
jgi:hypothetical protein